MAQRKGNFSDMVSKTLDSIGHSWPMVLIRRDVAKHTEIALNRICSEPQAGTTVITAGSQREGVCKPLGSDFDKMSVVDGVICCNDPHRFTQNRDLTLFKIDQENCSPGYTCLELRQRGKSNYLTDTDIEEKTLIEVSGNGSCISDYSKSYISSTLFIDYVANDLQNDDQREWFKPVYMQRAGPSIRSSCYSCYHHLYVEYDNVFAFTFLSPDMFEEFRNRPRRYNWPPPEVLQELSQLEAHVVPVGDKTSANHSLQWRICFTRAEIRLIECLTKPQLHVFVLLKIFAKEVLKPIWDKMTSYLMKNVILWISELTPPRNFRSNSIVDRFLDCLIFLKHCIKLRFLPSYMIADRNLLKHDSFVVTRKRLITFLEECLDEKGSCLLKSTTLKEALLNMYSHPEKTTREGAERDQTEKLLCDSRIRSCVAHCDTDEETFQCFLSSELLKIQIQKLLAMEGFATDPVGSACKHLQIFFSHFK